MSNKAMNLKSIVEQLGQRIAELEREVARLKGERATGPTKDWRRTIGIFPDNELLKQIDAAGQEIRREERRAAKQRGNKSKKASA